MSIKQISRTYFPILPLAKNIKIKQLESPCKQNNFEGPLPPNVIEPYLYTEDKGSQEGKKERLKVKMPGFVDAESVSATGYFTQKAKKQLEEMKTKGVAKPDISNPEKKE